MPGKNDAETPKKREGIVIRKNFLGAQSFTIKGLNQQEGKVNYFIGSDKSKWKTGMSTFQEVIYENVYAYTNLRYISSLDKLKYQFEIAPGGNPESIKMEVSGADSLSIDPKGNMIVKTPKLDIVELKPYVYQIIDNKTIEIKSSFKIIEKFIYGFEIDTYDPKYPLVVDP